MNIIKTHQTILLPNMLIIAGDQRNIGKTWLACMILKQFALKYNIIGLKISPHYHNNMKEKMMGEKEFFVQQEMKKDTGKDSSRMLQSGAAKVFYIESEDLGLEKNMDQIKKIIHKQPVICESGGLPKYVNPGLFIFIQSQENGKNSEIKKKADILLDNLHGKVYFDVTKLDYKNRKWIYNQ